MAIAQGVWKRIGEAFGRNGDNAPPRIFTNGARDSADNLHLVSPAAKPETEPRSNWSWLPWRRRAAERNERVANAIEALQHHLERQDRRAVELTQAVDSLSRGLHDLIEQQRAQAQSLAQVGRSVESAARSSAEISTALFELPNAMNAQAEAVRGIGRQFEGLQNSAVETDATLRRIHTALEGGRIAGEQQAEAIRRAQLESYEERRELHDLLRRGGRRMMITTLAAAAAAVAILSLVLVLVLAK